MFYLGSTPRDVEGQGSLFAGFEEGKLHLTYVTQLLDHSRTDLHLVYVGLVFLQVWNRYPHND
jgi:hypothetical protein